MSRYIDADAIVTKLNSKIINSTTAFINNVLIGLVNNAPTADVVEVVRCKDCKYWDTRDSKGIQGICLCGEKDFYYGSEFYPFADDYCSYGERRSENEG